MKPKNTPVRGYMEGSGGDVITDTINGFVRRTEETHKNLSEYSELQPRIEFDIFQIKVRGVSAWPNCYVQKNTNVSSAYFHQI